MDNVGGAGVEVGSGSGSGSGRGRGRARGRRVLILRYMPANAEICDIGDGTFHRDPLSGEPFQKMGYLVSGRFRVLWPEAGGMPSPSSVASSGAGARHPWNYRVSIGAMGKPVSFENVRR